jgi:hypothetical protein
MWKPTSNPLKCFVFLFLLLLYFPFIPPASKVHWSLEYAFWASVTWLYLSPHSQRILAAGRDFWEKPPAFPYCQLIGWCSVVSHCDSSYTGSSANQAVSRAVSSTLQQSLYRADDIIDPGPGPAKPAVLFPSKNYMNHFKHLFFL